MSYRDFLSEVVADLLRTPGALAVRVLWTSYNRKRRRMERCSAILSHGDPLTAQFDLLADQDLDDIAVYLVGQLEYDGAPPAANADPLQFLILGRGSKFPAPARLEDVEYSRRNLSYTLCLDIAERLRGMIRRQSTREPRPISPDLTHLPDETVALRTF